MKNNRNLGQNAVVVNRIVLGLLFLVAGLMKLFVFKPSGVTAMLAGIGFPLAAFFAWILILVEILGGISLLVNRQTKYAAYLLIIVMVVAAFTSYWGQWTQMLLHIAAAANLWVIAASR